MNPTEQLKTVSTLEKRLVDQSGELHTLTMQLSALEQAYREIQHYQLSTSEMQDLKKAEVEPATKAAIKVKRDALMIKIYDKESEIQACKDAISATTKELKGSEVTVSPSDLIEIQAEIKALNVDLKRMNGSLATFKTELSLSSQIQDTSTALIISRQKLLVDRQLGIEVEPQLTALNDAIEKAQNDDAKINDQSAKQAAHAQELVSGLTIRITEQKAKIDSLYAKHQKFLMLMIENELNDQAVKYSNAADTVRQSAVKVMALGLMLDGMNKRNHSKINVRFEGFIIPGLNANKPIIEGERYLDNAVAQYRADYRDSLVKTGVML